MKAAPHYIHSNHPAPSFFGHVFYWMWEFTPKNGLPDRSWLVVSLAQYAYFLFPVALCMQFLSDDIVRVLYEADGNLTILPLVAVFGILVWRNLYIYNERKYHKIREYYLQVNPAERIRHKRRCLLFMVLTVIVILIEVWLFHVFYNRCLLYPSRLLSQ